MKEKKGFVRYAITTSVGFLITFLVLLAKDVFSLNVDKDIFHALTDAFFVAGILITGYGLLIISNNEGTFDMIAYGVTRFFDLFRRDIMKVKHKNFYEYHKAKREKKQSFGYLLIVGIAFIVISLIFLWLYYKAL